MQNILFSHAYVCLHNFIINTERLTTDDYQNIENDDENTDHSNQISNDSATSEAIEKRNNIAVLLSS